MDWKERFRGLVRTQGLKPSSVRAFNGATKSCGKTLLESRRDD